LTTPARDRVNGEKSSGRLWAREIITLGSKWGQNRGQYNKEGLSGISRRRNRKEGKANSFSKFSKDGRTAPTLMRNRAIVLKNYHSCKCVHERGIEKKKGKKGFDEKIWG